MPPFTNFEIALLNHVGCAPSMMMPNSWILVGGFEALCNFHKVKDTVEAFFYFFQMNFPHKGSWFYFQARGRGPHAKRLFQDLKDPTKDWKKDFFLVRPRRGCQPAWWLREDGTPLFPTKWVEHFEAVPRTVLRTSSADTQKIVRVMSALPSGLDIDYYFVTDETVLSLVRREEAKHGKTRSADCSESSSAHQTRPRGGSKDEDPKKSRGKGHSSHTGGKGKASASSGSKTSGSAGRRRSHEKGTELRSPSPKRVKVSVPAPESGTRDGSDPSAPGVPAVVATEKHSLTLLLRLTGSLNLPRLLLLFQVNEEVVKRCEESIQKEKVFLTAEKELEQLRPEMASLRSSKQLLKVQLENAQKELQVWRDRSSAQGDEVRALRRAKESIADGQRKLIADHNSLLGEYESLLKQFHEAISENTQLKDALDEERETVKALTDDWSGAMEWGWSNCLDQVRFFNPRVDLELRHVNLHHEVEGENVVDISTRAVLWKGPFDTSQELSPDDMMEGTPSEVAEGAKEKEDSSAHEAVGPEEPLEGPRAKPTVVEPRAMELKPAASSEEFANSILAD
ncbi:uncharacterized protein G2W53_037427 [Senna tora]|uniref:Transposase (putative) gypsy type domain-containing protein n=1 Tax=Senna tora TaxID=362788 RepID=A0A834SVA6_9FABA|nr:uncharacterized protein G2W53_037427 [Senna tora]